MSSERWKKLLALRLRKKSYTSSHFSRRNLKWLLGCPVIPEVAREPLSERMERGGREGLLWQTAYFSWIPPLFRGPAGKTVRFMLSSVQSCPTLWDPVDCSTPDLCPSPTPRIYSIMSIESVMPSNISSSFIPFSSYLQSFPATGSFQMSQFLASGGQSIGVSALTSVLPVNIQHCQLLGK